MFGSTGRPGDVLEVGVLIEGGDGCPLALDVLRGELPADTPGLADRPLPAELAVETAPTSKTSPLLSQSLWASGRPKARRTRA